MQGQEKTANADLGNTHYWSVRGRGFSDKQWRALLNVTSNILENAKDENIAIAGPDGDGDPVFLADKIMLNGPAGNMGEPFVLRRTMSDHPFESCKTYNNDYEVVVSSILTAAKKIAPDVIELSAYGDPEPRRILAMSDFKNALKLAATNSKVRSAVLPLIVKNANLDNENIRKAVLALAARNPRVREALGRNLQAKFPEGKSVDVGKWLRDNGHADAAEKWEKYEGEMDGKQKTEAAKQAGDNRKLMERLVLELQDFPHSTLKELHNYGVWKRAANLRLASTRYDLGDGKLLTKGQMLKQVKSKHMTWDSAKNKPKYEVLMGITDEGKSFTVSAKDFDKLKVKDHTKPATLEKLVKMMANKLSMADLVEFNPWAKGKSPQQKLDWLRKKTASEVPSHIAARRALAFVRDFMTRLSLTEIHRIAAKNPEGKLASIDNSKVRLALAEKRAEQWIQDAVKRPGRVREYLDIPKGETIPMGKIDSAIDKVKGTGDRSLLSALLLAKRLKKDDLGKDDLGKKASFEREARRDNYKVVVLSDKIRLQHEPNSVVGAILLEELPAKPLKSRHVKRLFIPFGPNSSYPGASAFISDNILQDAKVGRGDNYDAAKKKLEKALEIAGQNMEKSWEENPKTKGRDPSAWFSRPREESVHYLQVEPKDYKPMTVKGKDFSVNAEWNNFSAYSPDSDFQSHDPHYTQYKAKSPAAGRKLYKILKANPEALANVSWGSFADWLRKHKVHHETNFSVWR